MAAHDLRSIDRDEVTLAGQGEGAPSGRGEGGPRVGRYRVVYEIATGGMATVYLAVPDGGRDAVALKRVHPHLASQRAFVEMFLDEARITSRIDHPNVCRVLDYGLASGSYYLTMEYLRGRSLARIAKALRALPDREHAIAAPILAARVVADAARGLHAAHELRDEEGVPLEVVHRDVSPHNLFVTWDGVTSVVDFGIASARDRLHHTETGTVKGKFAYMAPEQMIGASVDRRADIWSLGVVLWELLAGRTLFKRKTETETVVAATRMERPSLSSLRPGVSPRLEAIVDRALARDPDERHPSAAALAEELERWLSEQPGPGDAGEVAAWLRELFPGEADDEDALVRRALSPRLAASDDRTSGERSQVVRRSSPPPGLTRRLTLLVYAASLVAAIAIGALAALWPRGTPAPPLKDPARERAAAVLAAGHGAVSIAASGGWAEVYEGERRLGTTPGRFVLREGAHQLALRPHGGTASRALRVRVRAGEESHVRVALDR